MWKIFQRSQEPRYGDAKVAVIESLGARPYIAGEDKERTQRLLAEVILGDREAYMEGLSARQAAVEDDTFVPFQTVQGRIGAVAARHLER